MREAGGQGGLPAAGWLEGPAFDDLRDRVLRAGGVDIGLSRDRCVVRRLAARMEAVGALDLAGYGRRIQTDPEELRRLVEALTVNVSEFFRNAATFRALARDVWPQVVAQKCVEGRQGIRVWSAGCATGEEPYSLAVTLREFLGDALGKFAVMVFATDVDAPSLQAARAGRYSLQSVARVPRQILGRHFEPSPGGYRVCAAVRRLVHFRQHNLLDPFPFRRIDVAMLRNVLIYMARPLHCTILDAFYDALNPGGFLVLGKVEGLAGASRERFEVVNLAERIYRKPLASSPAATAVSPREALG